MTLPAGNPLWARTASAAAYGAHANLRDYGNIGSVNANTDVNSGQYKRLGSDCAAGALTAPICTMLVRFASGNVFVSYVAVPWAPILNVEYAGNSPPSSVYPTVTRASNVLTVTLPSLAYDEYGVSAPVVARIVIPGLASASWNGPTENSTFGITSSVFAAGSGTCSVVVY
jgi:hypothetical protein